MNPVSFPEQNCTYVADKCLPLPTCQQVNEEFQTIEVISCHEFSDEEMKSICEAMKLQ